MLCVDRRERTLPLYFSRAIARFDYVAAKVVAISLLTMTLSLVPAVILWIGRQLVDDSPLQAIRDNAGDLWRVLLLGFIIAAVLGTLGLMVSSFTDRKGVAIMIILIGFLVLTGIANASMDLLEDREWSRYLILLSFADSFAAISDHLFHDVDSDAVDQADLSLSLYLGYAAAIVAAGIVILRWRYSPRDES